MKNPFTPGVGLEPTHLAGRESFLEDYKQRLHDSPVQGKNTLVMGLRGVGKSVLMRHFSTLAHQAGWVPVFRELSKRSNNEDDLIHGLLADIALKLKGVTISRQEKTIGLGRSPEQVPEEINLEHLVRFFGRANGDKGDKFQQVLKYASDIVASLSTPDFKLKGIVLMLDEFQLLEDINQNYSLSLILDSISKLQSSTLTPIHAVFAGLPTMLGKMVECKPHAERLFSNVVDLGALSKTECREAITGSLRKENAEGKFSDDLVEYIAESSTGYPYFLQYFSHLAFNTFEHSPIKKSEFESILPELYAHLDETFYAGRLFPLSLKERAITLVSSEIKAPFTPSQLLEIVKRRGGDVSMGTIQQYVIVLQNKNIIYKVRRGSYDYALPLFSDYLKRCLISEDPSSVLEELGKN